MQPERERHTALPHRTDQTTGSLAQTVEILLDNRATLVQPTRELADTVKQRLTLPNPVWQENQRRGRWNRGVEKDLCFYTEEEENLIVPRGCMRLVITACRQLSVPFALTDRRRKCAEVPLILPAACAPFRKRRAAKC